MLDDPVQRFYTVIGTAIPVVRNMLSIALRPALQMMLALSVNNFM